MVRTEVGVVLAIALLGCRDDGAGDRDTGDPTAPTETAADSSDTAPPDETGGSDTGVTGHTGAGRCEPGKAVLDGLAYDGLQDALDAVAADPGLGDVTVCAGVHAGPFVARGAVRLVGEGDAVLDGLGAGTTLTVDPGSAVEGLTIRGGQAPRGGGLRLAGAGALAVRGCTLEGNRADEGAGLAVEDATLDLADTVIRDNTATGRGGGLSLAQTTATLTNVSVEGNHAAEGAGAWLYVSALTGGTFAGNEADHWAGGLAVWFSEATAITVTANRAGSSAGGVLMVDEGVLRDVAITANRAPSGAGLGSAGLAGGYAYGGFNVLGGTISGNVAAGDGGGAAVVGLFFAQDVAFADNVADRGAGVAGLVDAQIQLAGGALTGNVAATTGGAVWSEVDRYPLDANAVDFGSGPTDNAPDDVALGSVTWDYGAGATFLCDAGTCR